VARFLLPQIGAFAGKWRGPEMVETLTRRAFSRSVGAAAALAGFGAPVRAADDKTTLRFNVRALLLAVIPDGGDRGATRRWS